MKQKTVWIITKKDRLFRMLFQTQEILTMNKEVFGFPHKHTSFWEGYLKSLKDVAREIFGIDVDSVTFDWKLKVGERLQKKFPSGEVGFSHNGICYTVNEVLGLLALRNLFANNMGG